jgi:predicted enzyme related to lactoylglutathione lyase
MVERNAYADGEPCWIDVITPDLAAGKRFYAAMFGWEYDGSGPDDDGYTMCLVGGRPVAGISLPPDGGPSGPPAWTVYLASSDAVATTARIDRAGGKVGMGPLEIPGSGHMVVATDPTGAVFGVWQGTGHPGAAAQAEAGTLAWSEIATRDGGAADAFYRSVFDYEQESVGGDVDYTVWSIDGNAVCGRTTIGELLGPEFPPQWLVYFAVDDADAAVERATAGGGRLTHGPFDTPYGRIAILSDPFGALFSAIDMSRRTDS